ncbi:hypothetical protein [Arsenicitalea aurantiaca]|uniref:hypothetical protein n=1 Tax=Arsenicitalea aurantiaca TaxID=1783274 RepID=UPI0013159107|nr:hypothetical protein [Arsenicitalea aurantiaca]
MEIATQLTMMQAARTQGLANIAIVKKQHEMDMALIAMIDEVARSAPPPGQGAAVDKLA